MLNIYASIKLQLPVKEIQSAFTKDICKNKLDSQA